MSRGRRRAAAVGLGLAVALAAVPAYADLLPSPLPLPSISTSPLPLPTTSPLPLPTASVPTLVTGGSTASPSPKTGTGGSSTGSGSTVSGGGRSTQGAGGGGTASGQGSTLTGSGGGGSRPAASAGDPSTGGVGPLPAIPGLPHGVAQSVGWFLLILVPLMLLIWVVALIRTLSRLRSLRSPATLIAAAAELGLSPREIAGISPSALEKLRDQLAVDELTGCMRRAMGIAALDREISRARRERTPLAIAFVDADGLKHANDTLGHAAGDQLLKDVAEGLRTRLRGSDFVFRYGGDEFVCVLPGATAASAMEVFGDVQMQLRQRGRSFSLGVTDLRADDHDSVALLGRADEALYAAKRALKAGRQPSAPVRVLPGENATA